MILPDKMTQPIPESEAACSCPACVTFGKGVIIPMQTDSSRISRRCVVLKTECWTFWTSSLL